MEALKPASYNPFLCTHSALPVNVVLLVKLTLLGFILQGDWQNLPSYYLPFIPVFDTLGNPPLFKLGLQVIFVVGFLLVFTNRQIRAGALMTGSAILIGILSSRPYYRNALFYTSLLLILSSLPTASAKQIPTFLRWQVRLLYLGAATNKFFEPDWLSGVFFENLLKGQWANTIRGYFPPLLISKILGWATIATEFALFIGFSYPALYRAAVWLGILFHGMITFVINYDFGIFLIATAASYLAFVVWPKQVMVETDRANRFHQRISAILSRTNWDRILTIRADAATSGLRVYCTGRSYQGWLAWRQLFLVHPLFYFLVVCLLSLFSTVQSLRWLTLMMLILFNPLWDLLARTGDTPVAPAASP